MMPTPFRLLYLPNERTLGDQVGPRRAFEEMAADGTLSGYAAFSYLCEEREHGHAETLRRLMRVVQEFDPDVIYWAHVGNFGISRRFVEEMQASGRRRVIAYYEEDPFSRFLKRITPSMHKILSVADIVFTGGLGDLEHQLRECGAKKIVHALHSFDRFRSGRPWEPTRERKYDVVMIASNGRLRRLPFLFLPGGRKRHRLAVRLHEFLGDRLAVFGRGWDGHPFAKGFLPFNEQEAAIRQSRISINWSHFDTIPFYFSDRLPISMAAGVPHITNHQPGLETIFRNAEGLYLCRSVDEMVDHVKYLLSQPQERLNELGRKAADFAFRHLEATVVHREIVLAIAACIDHAAQL